jgi:hypothetical protein
MRASYRKELYNQMVSGLPLVFTTCLENFQSKLDDISLLFRKSQLLMKSHIEDQTIDDKSLLHTEVLLDPDEFDVYQIFDRETQLTFGLREFKALLSFAESLGQAIHIYFAQGEA